MPQEILLKSKIHRATVTAADLNYEGSITVDRRLMDLAKVREYERVSVVNITNGARLETYVIQGPPDSGTICLNGAAARLVQPGDLVIIMAYVLVDSGSDEYEGPRLVMVDEWNRPLRGPGD